MLTTQRLLFPCCIRENNCTKEFKEKGCSSALAHVIVSLVVGLLASLGAALAAYFMTHALIWTTVAAVAGFLVPAAMTYVILRCLQKPATEILTEGDLDVSIEEPIAPIKKYSFETGNNEISRSGLSTVLEQIKDTNFTEEIENAGIVFIDPSNELPIPFIRLYQTLLPLAGDKKEIVLELFGKEVDKKWQSSENKETDIRKYTKYFDSTTISELAGHTKHAASFLKKQSEFATSAAADPVSKQYKLSIKARESIIRQLEELKLAGKYVFGTAQDDGSCFFHSVAQSLSHHLKMTITEKMLRSQCIAYMIRLENNEDRKVKATSPKADAGKMKTWVANALDTTNSKYDDEIRKLALSSKDCQELSKKQKPMAPVWGRSDVHGPIIAELYGVDLVFIDGQVEEYVGDETIEFETDPVTIKPYRGKGRITLADIGYPNIPVDTNQTFLLANMGEHFFPIWIDA